MTSKKINTVQQIAAPCFCSYKIPKCQRLFLMYPKRTTVKGRMML